MKVVFFEDELKHWSITISFRRLFVFIANAYSLDFSRRVLIWFAVFTFKCHYWLRWADIQFSEKKKSFVMQEDDLSAVDIVVQNTFSDRLDFIFAGFPKQMASSGTSLVTTAPMPTTVDLPILIPCFMWAPIPI